MINEEMPLISLEETDYVSNMRRSTLSDSGNVNSHEATAQKGMFYTTNILKVKIQLQKFLQMSV